MAICFCFWDLEALVIIATDVEEQQIVFAKPPRLRASDMQVRWIAHSLGLIKINTDGSTKAWEQGFRVVLCEVDAMVVLSLLNSSKVEFHPRYGLIQDVKELLARS
ncbi:hypothetical protein DITRI_Ditri06bG0158600 [Diplodiscus trichospermus]